MTDRVRHDSLNLRFDKAELTELLKAEYKRLGSVLEKCNVHELVKRVEVELSKNSTFKVLDMSHQPF